MFTAKNIRYLLIALGVITVGYILLGQGPVDNPLSMSVAPVVLMLAYIVLVPLAILVRDKSDKKAE